MKPDKQQINMMVQGAYLAYRNGNIPLSELLCQHVLRANGKQSDALKILGAIASRIGEHDFAVRYMGRAASMNPADKEAAQLLAELKSTPVSMPVDNPDANGAASRILFIKSWGYGFWSEMDHVLGQLLLANMTGRVPFVYWGENSLFRDASCDNAFEQFFQPVSDLTLEDVVERAGSIFPRKWNRANLKAGEVNKWEGPDSRMAAILLLNREEDIVVSDFHSFLKDLLPWVHPGHVFYGREPEEIYRYLFAKYIKLRPEIECEINGFYKERLEGRNVLAVHVRGTDKLIEAEKLQQAHAEYASRIEVYLQKNPDAILFLLTDSRLVLEEYIASYGKKLVYTECARSTGKTGVHNLDHGSRKQIGVEILKDVWLAARATHFIGYGRTNVSAAILHIREWRADEFEMIGDNLLYLPNFHVHKR